MGSFADGFGRRGSVVLIVAIALLLPALAVLQYEWTGELSQLEQLRARSNLSSASQQFSTRFDAMLAGVYTEFHGRLAPQDLDAHAPLPPLPGGVPYTRLARTVYVIDQVSADEYIVREDVDGADEGARVPWPDWLDAGDLQRTVLEEVPALVVRRAGQQGRWLVVLLDMDTIVTDVLPALIASCVGGGIPLDYDVLINRDDAPEHVLYESRPGLTPAVFESGVSGAPLFAVHGRDLDPFTARGLTADAAAHRWRFFIKDQDGALEAAVGWARTRNLGIGAGVLALLALSVGLLVVSARRAERGVRDQLDVVARMSHELRTPLATITCAGENLAADVVGGAADVRQYGEIIRSEGRRLNKTIADILLCCRLQTRPEAALDLGATDIGTVIDGAVADSVMLTGETPDRVVRLVEPGLPTLTADAAALRVAVKNLIVNALRHARGSAVRVSARLRRGGGVVVEVEDEGPGIPDEERSRVFDTFFRGRLARDGRVEGSGIGLSVVYHVVRGHGGSVAVSPVSPHGTRFTVNLPASGRPSRHDGTEA